LCGITGIENRTIDDSATYIAGWARKLRDGGKLIIHAAVQAQRMCDYMLNLKSWSSGTNKMQDAWSHWPPGKHSTINVLHLRPASADRDGTFTNLAEKCLAALGC
jgi:hypothetical protein